MDVKLLGEVIGTATTWDYVEYGVAQFYNFTPNTAGKNLACELCDVLVVDLNKGLLEHFAGENSEPHLICRIKAAPR